MEDSYTNHIGDAYNGFRYAPVGFLYNSHTQKLFSIQEIKSLKTSFKLTARAAEKLGIAFDKSWKQSLWGTFEDRLFTN